jgi:hypothetical protein
MAKKFSEVELRSLAKSSKILNESSSQILKSFASKHYESKRYDIFLSHSYQDAEVIHGLKIYIETTLGLSVYVDWIDTPELNRINVSKITANKLRSVMNNCKTMLVAYSESVPESKWVPWEVGYFDSSKGRIAVIPIAKTDSSSEEFGGQEYLGLYSYAVHGKSQSGNEMIWVQNNPKEYIELPKWVNGSEPYVRGA